MSKYIIQWCEQKQTTVGDKLAVTLRDEKGQDLTGVTMWAKNWPTYQTLKAGDEVEGDIVSKQNGQYLNITLYPIRSNLGPKPASLQKSSDIKAAQETKRKDIEHFQQSKEESIKMAGAMRDATLITLASLQGQPFPSDDDFKREWNKWRSWLIEASDQPF